MRTSGFKVKRLRWWMLCFFVVIMLFNYIDRSSLSIALALISRDFGLSTSLAGVLSSAFFWSYTFMQIPGGWLTQKYKPRAVITTALVGWGISQALTAVAASFNVFIWCRLLLGIFEGPVQVGMNTSTLRWLSKNERGRGSTIIDSGGPLGSAIGSIVVTGLIVWLGTWRAAFIFMGALTLLVGLLAWLFIRNNPSQHPLITSDEADYLEAGIAQEEAIENSEETLAKATWGSVFSRLSPWMLLIAFCMYDAVQYGLLTWVPFYIAQSRHVSFAITGVASMVVYLGGFAGEMVVGQISDRWLQTGASPNKVLRTLFVTAGVGVTLCMLFVNVVADVSVAVALLTIANFFTRWGGLYWSVPQRLVRRNQVAVLSGAMNFAGNVAGIAIPIVVGFIADVTGSFTGAFIMFAVCGILMALSSAMIQYFRKGETAAVVAEGDARV